MIIQIENYKSGPGNYSYGMTFVDEIIKWFKRPKTLYGIVGMVGIIIILAADFAYWAGAIDVIGLDGEEVEEEVEDVIETEEVNVYHDEQVDTILIPGFGVIGGSATTMTYDFPVEDNATRATIITTNQGNNARPDIDLYIYGPDGSEVASSAGATADEAVELDYKDFERKGYGQYTAEVRNFSNVAATYEIVIDVYKEMPVNQTDEGE
jgi:hypothetical protein